MDSPTLKTTTLEEQGAGSQGDEKVSRQFSILGNQEILHVLRTDGTVGILISQN